MVNNTHTHLHQSLLQKHIIITSIIGPPFSGKHKQFQQKYETNGYQLVHANPTFSVDHIRSKIASSSSSTTTSSVMKLCVLCINLEEESHVIQDRLGLRYSDCELNRVFVHCQYGLTQSLWASEFCFAEQFDNSDQCYNESIVEQLKQFYQFFISNETPLFAKESYRRRRNHNEVTLISTSKSSKTNNNNNSSSGSHANVKSSSQVEVGLFVNRDAHVFTHQGLIIDAHALFTPLGHRDDNENNSDANAQNKKRKNKKRELKIKDEKLVSYMFQQWNCMKGHDHGRIILFYDYKQFRKALSIPDDDDALTTSKCVEMMRDAILNLDLSFPVYYVYGDNSQSREENLFFQMPNPGMFAFVQYSHSLNMAQSLYLRCSIGSSITRSEQQDLIPVKFCEYDSFCKVFERLGAVTESQRQADILSETISSELKQMVNEPNSKLVKMIETMEHCSHVKSVLIPTVKRFPLLQQLAYDDDITDECFFELKGRSCSGRAHGIILQRKYIQFFEDQEDNFESRCEEITRGSESSTADIKVDEYEEPKSPVTKLGFSENTQFISPVAKRANTEQEQTITPPSKQQSEHKILMTIPQISQLFGIVYFQRGRDYKNSKRISHLRTKTVTSNAFKLYSMCDGSRDEPYKQESLFKSGKLLKSICTCPIGEENGGCKHVCAQLLAYLDKENYEKSTVEADKSRVKLPTPQLFSSLDPMDDKWCIRGKVLKKTNVKNWANRSNSGKVAAVLLQDELVKNYTNETVNQIKVVMFTEAINEFYDLLEEKNTYYIAFGNLQHSNPNHNSTAMTSAVTGQISQYEIQLNPQFSIVRPTNQLGFSDNFEANQPAKSKSAADPSFREHFETRVAKEGDGTLAFAPFCEDVRPASPTKQTTPKKRRVHEIDDDDDDPLRLLEELNDTCDDRVEKEQDSPIQEISSSKSVSPSKKRKVTSQLANEAQRRYSEPVRKLTFPDSTPDKTAQQTTANTEVITDNPTEFKTPKKVSLVSLLSALRNT